MGVPDWMAPAFGQAGWSDSSHHHHARMTMAMGHETAQARKLAKADRSVFTRELLGMTVMALTRPVESDGTPAGLTRSLHLIGHPHSAGVPASTFG
jgi:hypothetical protein